MTMDLLQQQIHAQQLPHAGGPGALPLGPHPVLPGMGPAPPAGLLGFGAGLPPGGAPHPAVSNPAHPLLKSDLHPRSVDELKRPSSTHMNDDRERLVRSKCIGNKKGC